MRRVKLLILAAGLFVSLPLTAHAQVVVLPIIEEAEDDLDTCALAQVTGLKADGDGFLAVRSAPGSNFRKLDEVYNGDRVWVFQQIGKWYGVVYGVDSVECNAIDKNRPLQQPGKKGWVHSNWVQVIAG